MKRWSLEEKALGFFNIKPAPALGSCFSQEPDHCPQFLSIDPSLVDIEEAGNRQIIANIKKTIDEYSNLNAQLKNSQDLAEYLFIHHLHHLVIFNGSNQSGDQINKELVKMLSAQNNGKKKRKMMERGLWLILGLLTVSVFIVPWMMRTPIIQDMVR